jgi:hypothetical protein
MVGDKTMRHSMLLVALAAMCSSAAIASADGGSNAAAKPSTAAAPAAASAPAAAAPAASKPAATTGSYQRGYRRGWFSGRSAKNWYLNRGTPDDNSTIPTPVNRHPKGRPQNDPVFFPKNM